MDKKLVLNLVHHDIYFVTEDDISYYIGIPKNIKKSKISIELKSKMGNYNPNTNDELWVMDNIKSTFSYIDQYNITLVLPILSDDKVDIIEKMDKDKFEIIDKILGKVINSAYMRLKEDNREVEAQVIMIDNSRYKVFINWFVSKYNTRIICKSLLEVIQYYNVNATMYKKINTPGMTYVVGTYQTEVDAPKIVKEEPKMELVNLKPARSTGFSSYWLIALMTIVLAGVIALIAFMY